MLFCRGAKPIPQVSDTTYGLKVVQIRRKEAEKMDEEIRKEEIENLLNQEIEEGKTEIESYRKLMKVLGIDFPKKKEVTNS